MFAERLSLLDTESDLLEAFACFDDDDSGVVDGDILREWLSGVGDKMSTTEVSFVSLYLPSFKNSCRILRISMKLTALPSDRQTSKPSFLRLFRVIPL